MSTFFEKLKALFADKTLRNRILFMLGALAFFRLLAAVPIPGVNEAALANFLGNNQYLGLLNIFSGGGLSTLSIVMLGVGPYITASIIMQLVTMMSDKIKAMYTEEGEMGRRKFNQYTRLITVPLAFIQAFAFIIILQRAGIVPSLGVFDLVRNAIVIVAGSIFLMWIGELMTEFGIGNGLSVIIFAGIVARAPQTISQIGVQIGSDQSQYPLIVGLIILAIIAIYAVVVVTEAERPIPVTYAKQVRGGKMYGGASTYLPLRLNQAGVIPIVFALSILVLPQMLFNVLSYAHNATISRVSIAFTDFLNNPWAYAVAYFILVTLFTFFYTAVTFDPQSISTNLQKNGAFIPGVRPGEPTSLYLAKVVTRITLVGAIFLGIIAVLPALIRAFTNLQQINIGGTQLLIVVSVVLDLVKKVDAQLAMREY